MKNSPLVSVVIPCFNSEKWIDESINSVLEREYTNVEILIVDDGSTDNTKEKIMNYKNSVTYIYQDNRGPSAARNKGINSAKGKYIAFLDADDMWMENKLSKQIRFMEENGEYALTFSNVNVVDENGKYLYTHKNVVPKRKQEIIRKLFIGNISMNTPTIIVKRDVANKLNGFDENLSSKEDHFFYECS